MEIMRRNAWQELLSWKHSTNRKPLVLRGARQVGKTTLVRAFAGTYAHSLLLNLEKQSDAVLFEKYDDLKTLMDVLLLRSNMPANQLDQTLLFIDEIQESPKAIQQLRYFHEEFPQIHVIAAGSLLDFALGQVKSFPVGRVDFLHLHPLNFHEFLMALGKTQALDLLQKIPIPDFAHATLSQLFHTYAIVGGMPEVVKEYLPNQQISALPKVYQSIWESYKSDVQKYSNNASERQILRFLMDVAPAYIDQRIKFQNFGNSNYKSREMGEAFRTLEEARFLSLVYPTTELAPPLKPDHKKSPKLQILDTGLVNFKLNIQYDMVGYDDLSFAYKGALLPHLIFQELTAQTSNGHSKLHFWVREKTQASAEVDLVYPFRNQCIPVEIKSGPTGKLKSLHEFIERCPHALAVRMYAGPFGIETHKTPRQKKEFVLMNLPYYLAGQLPKYLDYFVQKHSISEA